jgi:hypothetical protein
MWLWLVRFTHLESSINEITAKGGGPEINHPIESFVRFYAIRVYLIDRVPKLYHC